MAGAVTPAEAGAGHDGSHGGFDMKLSARNQLAGTVVSVVKGQTTAHVRVDIGGGKTVTASITNEAVEELGLAVGDAVTAVIKSSDVMIGKS